MKGLPAMDSLIKGKDFTAMRTPINCFESSYPNSKHFKANGILESVSKRHHHITALRAALCSCPRYSAAQAKVLEQKAPSVQSQPQRYSGRW